MSTERTQEIEEAASAWLMQRDAGRWGEADQARFDEWLRASTLHRVAYLRLELGWEDARRLQALGAGISGDEPPPPGQWNLTPFFDQAGQAGAEPAAAEVAKSRTRLPRPAIALAASVVLAVLAAWLLWPAGSAYETPVGGISSVPIADGSKITLNTDSQIRVTLTDSVRRIDLAHGEVFFEVAKDPRRPFIVTVGDKRVIAVGTKFSVRRAAGDVRVVVTDGKVRIEDDALRSPSPAAVGRYKDEPHGAQASAAPVPAPSHDVLLTAGSIARATDAGILIETRSVLEAEEQLSWRTGVLMFRNQRLGDAVAEFNRYNTRKLVIDDPAVAGLRIEGNFRATNVDAFARLLEQVYPVSVEQRDRDRLLILPR